MKIFYSWQSDLPTETNNRAIANCIKAASLKLEEQDENIKLSFDEATRGKPGSPQIPVTILKKIEESDIFIADITIINSDQSSKKTPNPNVLFELGFAVSELGWDRIIMVYNRSFGDFPNDLPFDLDRRRVSAYCIKQKDDKNGKGVLTETLRVALLGILETKPLRPAQLKNKTSAEIKRSKDIENLSQAISEINIPVVDIFLEYLPDKISHNIFHYWEGFKSVVESSSFHLYDEELETRLVRFKGIWGATLNFGHRYLPNISGKDYHFYRGANSYLDPEVQKDYTTISELTQQLRVEFKSLIKFIREWYIEVDIDQLSTAAFNKFKDFQSDAKKVLRSDD